MFFGLFADNDLLSNFTETCTPSVYGSSLKSSGIFLNDPSDITPDVVLEIQKVINKNYNPTSCMPYEIEKTDNFCMLKFPIYTLDQSQICEKKAISNAFDYYAFVLILHPSYININSSWGSLQTFITKLSGFDTLIKSFNNTHQNPQEYQFLLSFTENNNVTFLTPGVVTVNGIEYYFITQCNPFQNTSSEYTFQIDYGWNQTNGKISGDISYQTIYDNTGSSIYDYNYDSPGDIRFKTYCITDNDCFHLKNANWNDSSYNINTSFGFKNDDNGGCFFPTYTDNKWYLYADAMLHDKTSFDFTDISNLDLTNGVNNNLYFPVPNNGGFKFVKIINNDTISISTKTSPSLKDLGNNNYYYNSTTFPSIQNDVINRALQFGPNESNESNGQYIKLSDNTYQDLSEFVNIYNSAGLFANILGNENIKGLRSGINPNYFYPMINCKPNTDGYECTFNIDDKPFYKVEYTTGGSFDSSNQYFGLSKSTSLFDKSPIWKNQYVSDKRNKSDPNYLSTTTNWKTTNDTLFTNQFYTRLSEKGYTVDTFCQSLGDSTATGSSSIDTIINGNFGTDFTQFLICSPSSGDGIVGPSPALKPMRWWQNCDPSSFSCVHDIGGGNKNFMIKQDRGDSSGWYPILNINTGKQLSEDATLSDVYFNLNKGNSTFKNGNCPYPDKNILTTLTSLDQDVDGSYTTDNMYRCLFRGTPSGMIGSSSSPYNGYPSLTCGRAEYDKGVSGLNNSPFTFMSPFSFKPDTNNETYYSVSNSWTDTVGAGKSFKEDTYPFYYDNNYDTSTPANGIGLGSSITIKNTDNADLYITVSNTNGIITYNNPIKPGDTQNIIITPVVNGPPKYICKTADGDTTFSSGNLTKNFKGSDGRCDSDGATTSSLPSDWCLNINDPFLDRSDKNSLPQFYITLKWGDENYTIVYDLGVTPNVSTDIPFTGNAQSCWFNEPNPSKWSMISSPRSESNDYYIYGSSSACRNVTQKNVMRFNFNVTVSDSSVFEVNKTDILNRIKISPAKQCMKYNTGFPQVLPGVDLEDCNCNPKYNADGTIKYYGVNEDNQCAPTGGPYTLFYALN